MLVHTRVTTLLALLVLVGGAACRTGAVSFDWRNPYVLRATGASGRDLGAIYAEDSDAFTDRHYVALTLERLFLRALPGFRGGDHVVVGLRVRGARDGDRPLSTVLAVSKLDPDGHLDLKPGAQIESFRYRGDLELEVHVRKVSRGASSAEQASARVEGAAALLRTLRPWQEPAVHTAAALYTSLVEEPRSAVRWRTTVRLVAGARGSMDRSTLLAGRTIFLYPFPDAAPEPLRDRVSRRVVFTGLSLPHDHVAWKETGDAYRETPYLVLAVQRSTRMASGAHPAYRQLAEVDELLRESLAGKPEPLAKATEAIAALEREPDPSGWLTALERALVTRLATVRRLRMESAMAASKGDRASQRTHDEALVALLDSLLRSSAALLTSGERMAFQNELGRLRRLLGGA